MDLIFLFVIIIKDLGVSLKQFLPRHVCTVTELSTSFQSSRGSHESCVLIMMEFFEFMKTFYYLIGHFFYNFFFTKNCINLVLGIKILSCHVYFPITFTQYRLQLYYSFQLVNIFKGWDIGPTYIDDWGRCDHSWYGRRKRRFIFPYGGSDMVDSQKAFNVSKQLFFMSIL